MKRSGRTTIPQATLASVRAAVVAAVSGLTTAHEIASRIASSKRHADYALSAARLLGLVRVDDGQIAPTPSGRRLAATKPGSQQEISELREAIRTSEQLAELAPGLLDREPPSVSDLAKRIAEAGRIGPGTARHRAGMLMAWRRVASGGRRAVDAGGRSSAEERSGMWRRIEISNFRSIAAARIDLAPFTLVVGPNGAGKSNFADALVFARDVSISASSAVETRGGIAGVRRWRPSKPTDVMIDVRASPSRRGLDASYVRHMFKIHSGLAGNWSFSRELIELIAKGERSFIERRGANLLSSDGSQFPSLTSTASLMVLASQLKRYAKTTALRHVRRYRLSPEAMRQPQLSTDKTRLDEAGANITVAVRDVRDTGKAEDLNAAMGKIVPGLLDVYVEQVGRYLTLKFKQAQGANQVAEFNATEMSEGALRALGIVVATLQMVPEELLIIEEPEVSVHVGAAALLFDVLKEASRRGAVLVTTHSADLLDAAKDEEILVCEYADGITRIGPLASAQRDVVRRGLFSVSELMRSEPLRIEGRSSVAAEPEAANS
jgi:type I restriction enzyme M protein